MSPINLLRSLLTPIYCKTCLYHWEEGEEGEKEAEEEQEEEKNEEKTEKEEEEGENVRDCH